MTGELGDKCEMNIMRNWKQGKGVKLRPQQYDFTIARVERKWFSTLISNTKLEFPKILAPMFGFCQR